MPLYQLGMCYAAGSERPDPAALEVIMRDLKTVSDEMQAAGIWIFAGGLSGPESATVVLDQDGEAVITDGPFVESKEQIGGYTLIEVADLDEAIGWARKVSAASTTSVEVRPFLHSTTK